MKKIVLFIAMLISFIACKKEQQPIDIETISTDVIIHGTIKNYKLDDSINSISLYLNRVIQNNQFYEKYPIDSSGNFTARFKMDRTQDLFIRYKNTFSLILKPSDSINLIFDGGTQTDTEFLQTIKLQGDSKSLNTDFISFQIERDFDQDDYYNNVRVLDNEAFKVYYDSIFTRQSKIITNFISKNVISDTLTNWLFVEKYYKPLDFLLGYPLDYSMYHNIQPNKLKLSDSFYKDLKNLPVLKDVHLVNSVLKHVGNRYHYHFIFKLTESGIKRDIKVLNSKIIDTLIETNHENPLLAQIALNDRIHYFLDNNSVDILDNNKIKLDSLFKGSVFQENLANNYTDVVKRLNNPVLSKNSKTLTFSNKDASTFLDEIVTNAKGKVIYIDNWATWCGPCKSEFKQGTPELKKEFGNQIEYVYLCHQSEEKLWKPTIEEYQIEGKHYFITKEQSEFLKDQLQIEGFPTYNIISKEGKLVHSGFEFRPSEKKTSDILLTLINE